MQNALAIVVPAEEQRDPMGAVGDDVLDRGIIGVFGCGQSWCDLIEQGRQPREFLFGDGEQVGLVGGGYGGLPCNTTVKPSTERGAVSLWWFNFGGRKQLFRCFHVLNDP